MKAKNTLVIGFILFLLFTSCTDKETKKEIKIHQSAASVQKYIDEVKKNRSETLELYIKKMPLEQKIAQLFIENLEGNTSFRSYETIGAMTGTDDERPLIAGGYIFFSYNISDTREGMQDYIKSIREYCEKYDNIQPYLCVDQEGGWVSRLKKLNPKLPSNEEVAKKYDVSGSYRLYGEQAAGMKELGFNMNLAPVVEVCTDDNKEFLDGRSYGNLEQVIISGRVCLNAYENNGIATVLKHFPGNTNTDPHTGLPEITLSEAELKNSIESFHQLVQYNPAAVLMSHARTSAIDKGVPACLSKVWVTDILRNQFGYQGLVFSDDIFMGALADNGYPPELAVIRAVEAGIDCIMISEKRFAKAGKVLYQKAKEDAAFEAKIDQAVKRIIKYKLEAGLFDEQKIR